MRKNSTVFGCMFFFALFITIIATGCNEDNKKSAYDTPRQGTINISVDESFEPVISEQIKVYESSYPQTKIIAEYKSEADCFRDLQKDSTRMIIVAKGLTKEEKKLFEVSFPLSISCNCSIVNTLSFASLFMITLTAS